VATRITCSERSGKTTWLHQAAESMPLNNIFAYFRAYDKRSFEVFACQGNEPSEADVAAFETDVGFALPDEFREFTMSPLGGLYMEVREDLWPRPELYHVGPFWSFLYGFKVFGIAERIPEWLDVRVQHAAFVAEGHANLVPFLQLVGDADKYCFDSAGRIVRWSHEEPENLEHEPMKFSELLMREIHELEERKNRKIGEAGSET
jgi:hypothetical protein